MHALFLVISTRMAFVKHNYHHVFKNITITFSDYFQIPGARILETSQPSLVFIPQLPARSLVLSFWQIQLFPGWSAASLVFQPVRFFIYKDSFFFLISLSNSWSFFRMCLICDSLQETFVILFTPRMNYLFSSMVLWNICAHNYFI